LAKFAEKRDDHCEQQTEIRGRLSGTTSFEQLADCDIIIEAIIENLDEKRSTYAADRICKPETIFASNTSSLSITEMMTATSAGAPAAFYRHALFQSRAVDEAGGSGAGRYLTDEDVYEQAWSLGRSLEGAGAGGDKTGFIVNRLLVPYMLDSIRALEEGVGRSWISIMR
jgi:3-hydroxybutyryl-CoA dehydrogenase